MSGHCPATGTHRVRISVDPSNASDGIINVRVTNP
jgi:hypothetical protein